MKWTRERIIREILRREEAGLGLVPGGDHGVACALYQAGNRIFGNWRNAVKAAGITPEKAKLRSFWTAPRILGALRYYARLKKPPKHFKRKHARLMSAAVRCFGSWSKALQAAGVDPSRFQRVVRWTEAGVIEAILKRALTNSPLGSQSTQPRSLVTAGAKFFGSWPAALTKAGLDPADHVRQCRQPGIAPPASVANARDRPAAQAEPRGRRRWSEEKLIEAIRLRHREGQKLTGTAVYAECRSLHTAGIRRFGNWHNSLIAAGLDPDVVASRRGRPPKSHRPSVRGPAETSPRLRQETALQTPAASTS